MRLGKGEAAPPQWGSSLPPAFRGKPDCVPRDWSWENVFWEVPGVVKSHLPFPGAAVTIYSLARWAGTGLGGISCS